jgi:hypothetical protein
MRKQRHRITYRYLNATEVEVVALALKGKSYRLIHASTGLRHHQISYRLAKAKRQWGLARGVGFARAYADTPLEQNILNQRKREVVDRLGNKFVHPVHFASEKVTTG